MFNIIKKVVITLAVSLIIAGCVPSLQPFYTEKDLVADYALLGEWLYKNGEFKFTFTQDKGMVYELMVAGGDSEKYYSVHLMKLKDTYFLDIYPKNGLGAKKYIFGNSCYVPAHAVGIVVIKDNSLHINMLNPITLEYLLKNKKIILHHEYFGDNILLTASTSELQRFLLRHRDEKGLFSSVYKLERKTSGAFQPNQ